MQRNWTNEPEIRPKMSPQNKNLFTTPFSVYITNFTQFYTTVSSNLTMMDNNKAAALASPCTIWWRFQQLTLEGRVQQSVSPTRPRGRRVISSWTHDGLTRTERLLVPVSLDRSLLLGPDKEDGITRVSSLSTPQPCVEQSLLRLLICYDRMITLKILWANLVSLLFFI